MNENIDLTKTLKDCPKGWKFYSSVYGEVEFVEILSTPSIQRILQENSWFLSEDDLRNYPIQFKEYDTIHRVTSAGEHIKGKGECTFFPSREQRDWSKFTAPWYRKGKFDSNTLKPFDKVLVRDCDNSIWGCTMFSHTVEDEFPYACEDEFPYACFETRWKRCIPYNEDTKHLVGTTDEAPEYYKYWES